MHAGTNVHLLVQGGPKPSLPLGFAPSTPDISDSEGAALSDSQVNILSRRITYTKAVGNYQHLMDIFAWLLCSQQLYYHAWRCMEYHSVEYMHS